MSARRIDGMFELFADRARRVVVLAQEEARTLKHSHLGTEHLLLGLLAQGEGMAAEALESLSITLDAARQQVAELVAPGQDAPAGSVPFTQRAKTVVVELSQTEARSLGHSEVDTAHLLLGLLREGTGTGAQVPAKLGVELDQVRLRVLQLLLPGGLNSSVPGEAVAASSRDEAAITAQLQGIQDTLTELSTRLATIERHLNVD